MEFSEIKKTLLEIDGVTGVGGSQQALIVYLFIDDEAPKQAVRQIVGPIQDVVFVVTGEFQPRDLVGR